MTVPPRFSRRTFPILVAFLVSILFTGILTAQDSASDPGFAQEVHKKLRSLSNYGVFDWITFSIDGRTVVLKGYAALPTLKSSAGNAVKSIHGVEFVDNRIEVLPTSMMDNRVRVAVYNRIYTHPALRKYNANRGTAAQAIGPGSSMVARTQGIIYDPPRGFNAIHIIVKNSHVMLFGVVDNESDKQIAGLQAKSTPDVLSVNNDLIVAQSAPKKHK